MRHVHLLFFARQGERSACHFLRRRDPLAFSEQENCVDCVWIIDVIGRDPGRIGSASRLRGEHFVKKPAFLDVAGEDFPFVDVLIANRGCEIFPARVFRVAGRITRIWRNVAGTARYADAIRAHELFVIVISWIVHETIAVPFLARFTVEIRIRKKPKAKHAGRLAVNVFVDAWRLLRRLFIEAQTKLVRLIRSARLKSRLIYQAQGFETFAARKFAVIKHLQKLHQPVAVLGGLIPKMLVTTAPEIPGIATHDFLWRKINAAVHRLENVGSNLRKISGCFPGRFCFVNWLVFPATAKREQRASDDAESDSGDTEKIAPGWQQYLHRTIIDTSLANCVARKF